MEIKNKGLKKAYLIHESSTGVYSICRILNEFDSKNEAINDLAKLLSNKKTEKNLLRQYTGIKENWFMRSINRLVRSKK